MVEKEGVVVEGGGWEAAEEEKRKTVAVRRAQLIDGRYDGLLTTVANISH